MGLTSVLLGTASVVEALQPCHFGAPVQVMTTGPSVPHPSELLGSTRMLELLTSLRQAGWTVVVDAPPVLPVADTALVARLADGVVLAVRSGSTEKAELADAVAALSAVGAPLLGTVLTAAPAATDGRYLQQVRHEAARSDRALSDRALSDRARSGVARHQVAWHDVAHPEFAQNPVGLGQGRTAPPVISAATPAHGVAMPGWSSVPLEPRQPIPHGQPIPHRQPIPPGQPIPRGIRSRSSRTCRRPPSAPRRPPGETPRRRPGRPLSRHPPRR